jgi:cell division protein FtsN
MPAVRSLRSRRRSAFHGGSFAAGIVLGVLLTLTGALLPGLLDEDAPGLATSAGDAPSAPAPKFEFFDSLPKHRVAVDPRPYAASTPRRPQGSVEYLLQAGSFASRTDAESLSRSLADLGLPASTVQARLDGGVERHRVIVGPFAAEDDVRRAQTKLRERNIDALLMARRPAAG